MWLVSYYKYNLQRLGSGIELVVCHTKNELVKSNSLANLNLTSKPCVTMSQRDSTYFLEEYPLSRTLVFHYSYHMLIAHLP
jgi:hypothetical protein